MGTNKHVTYDGNTAISTKIQGQLREINLTFFFSWDLDKNLFHQQCNQTKTKTKTKTQGSAYFFYLHISHIIYSETLSCLCKFCLYLVWMLTVKTHSQLLLALA